MAKPSPVMKHAKPQLTAEQIAIEEFMNSIPPEQVIEGDTIIDNRIRETLDIEENTLDPIVDSAVVADNLEELAGDIDAVTTAPAMESYKRIFRQITEMTGHPVASIEDFKATKGGVKKLAKAVRSHADLIRSCVSASLEDYVDKVDESIGTSMSNYKQALGELSRVRESSIDMGGDVVIDHKRFWRLFHLKGSLMDLDSFHKEVDGVKELAGMVRDGKDVIARWAKGEDSSGEALSGKGTIYLMNNTSVKVAGGRGKWETEAVDAPVNKEGQWTIGDFFWILVFNWAGLIYRIIKGGSGRDEAKKKQALSAISKIITEMKRLGPVVQGLEKDASDIVSLIEAAPEDRKSDLKRAASPVLELASRTVDHVTDVTYGTMKMFEQAEGKK